MPDKPKNIKEIVRQYLIDNGYDGLAGDDCGCGLDKLFPCGLFDENCQPAHKYSCEPDKCDNYCGCGMGGSECYRVDKELQS